MLSISLPKKPIYKKIDETTGQIIIEECFPRYGTTIGNSIRRVMLSSLEGVGIVSVKIKGVTHEFSAIDGVVEDVIQIILNLKAIRFKLKGGVDEALVFLNVKGKKEVTAKDLEMTSELEVVTPDAPIATITSSSTTLEMEIKVERGMGYVPVEQRDEEKEIGTITVDAIFNPIKRVNFTVENMRVGKRTDYERVILDVVTDGSISPFEAYQKAVQILIGQFESIVEMGEEDEIEDNEKEEVVKKEKVEDKKKDEQVVTKVSELNLPSRIVAVLEGAKISTIKQLKNSTESDLLQIEGLGEKAVKDIRKALGTMGIILKSDDDN